MAALFAVEFTLLMGGFEIVSMAELTVLVRMSVRPKEVVQEQANVMQRMERNINWMFRGLYLFCIGIIGLYTYIEGNVVSIVKNASVKDWRTVKQEAQAQRLNVTFSITSATLLLMCAILLIIVFTLMHNALKVNLVSEGMKEDKQRLDLLFAAFTFTYLLGSIYFAIFGSFQEIIPSTTARFIGQDFIVIFIDMPAALAIMYLHHLNFKNSSVARDAPEHDNQDHSVPGSPVSLNTDSRVQLNVEYLDEDEGPKEIVEDAELLSGR